MKKPEKNIVKRKAIIKRGKKRSDRAKSSKEEKHIRTEKLRFFKASQEKKFKEHLSNLKGGI